MTHEATRLAACPFCGSDKISEDFGDESACVRCRNCGCQSGRVYFTESERESDDFSQSEADAREAWNRRALDTGAREAALEEAAHLCEDISDKYGENEGSKWPELKSDAQTGARDCESAIRALATKTADAATETKQEQDHG